MRRGQLNGKRSGKRDVERNIRRRDSPLIKLNSKIILVSRSLRRGASLLQVSNKKKNLRSIMSLNPFQYLVVREGCAL
jgi:hypothetical protein